MPDPVLITIFAGPLVAAVRVASGRDPITVGKPNSPAFEYICRRWKIDPARTMMVGDRYCCRLFNDWVTIGLGYGSARGQVRWIYLL